MTKMNIICAECGKHFDFERKEYTRQTKRGRKFFFCTLSCAAKYHNAKRPDRRKKITKICPVCGGDVKTMTGSKSSTFCSRSCASKGSVTEKRRKAAREMGLKNLTTSTEKIARGLKSREWWKYEELHKTLNLLGFSHQFEYPIRNVIFDLALLDKLILVEFDGRGHNHLTDKRKAMIAGKAGWRVKHIKVKSGSIINPNVMSKIL